MEAERERAERHLHGLATHHGSMPQGPLQRSQSRERSDASRRVRFDRAARALTAIGVLSDSDVEPFRHRLGAEIERGPRPQSVIDDELACRARALLATRLRDVAEPETVPRADAVADFERVYVACKACGALAEAELSLWRERLREADGGQTWWLERERRQKRCTLTELRGVVLGDATRIGGVRIATAELYTDGLVLRWDSHAGIVRTPATAGADGAPGPGWYPPAVVSLTDDLGTEYLHVHTSQVMRVCVMGTSTFATVVPPTATQLLAQIGEQHLVVALPGPTQCP